MWNLRMGVVNTLTLEEIIEIVEI